MASTGSISSGRSCGRTSLTRCRCSSTRPRPRAPARHLSQRLRHRLGAARDGHAQRRTRPARPSGPHPCHPGAGVVHADFSETFLKPFGGAIVVPRRRWRGGLRRRGGRRPRSRAPHWPTRRLTPAPRTHSPVPEALTIAEAAKIISDVSGQAIDYTDIDRDEWVAARGSRRGYQPSTGRFYAC